MRIYVLGLDGGGCAWRGGDDGVGDAAKERRH